MAKETTDAILSHFKKAEWSCADGLGTEFYRGGTNADFPSPDAAFYDDTHKVKVSFEFKPPTETKRGILTGVGQSIAYLQNCNISYLVAPKMLEDYKLGDYLTDLYAEQISGKLPTGLILYENSNPETVSLVHNVDKISKKDFSFSGKESNRFWAKHVDQPLALFHTILHYYYLKKVKILPVDADPFAVCWKERMIPKDILTNFTTRPIIDIEGNPIMTVAGTKQMVYLEKKLNSIKNESLDKRIEIISHEIDTNFIGDNYFNSVKKNLITFHKHLQTIDSEGQLTERGFALYHIGLMNGATSKIFRDYFTKEVLITGHHIDLLLDYDAIKQENIKNADNATQILSLMEQDYENKGYLKRNPNRMSKEKSDVKFLKYERILWKALGLLDSQDKIQWKKITEICSLSDF
ncbi:MAG: hypothetical protein IJ558_13020 [Treponema sp.]|nr:hypothetical protein [Treponema sp.]